MDSAEDVIIVDLDASSVSEAPASNVEIMSLPLLLAWFVLTLYNPNLRRVRSNSARDFFASGSAGETKMGADSAGGACSLFWLAHSS